MNDLQIVILPIDGAGLGQGGVRRPRPPVAVAEGGGRTAEPRKPTIDFHDAATNFRDSEPAYRAVEGGLPRTMANPGRPSTS